VKVETMTEEERKNRKKKIRNLMRRLEITKEEAEQYLDELADGLDDFIKETKANIKVIGLEEFGTDKK
jgi:L-lactate utilization protein LutB